MTGIRFNNASDIHNFINRSAIGADRLINDFFHNYTDVKYPPYNIEAVSEHAYRITFAVAGFTREELTVSVENGMLRVVGAKAQSEDNADRFIHRGIAERDFERSFKLTEYVEVNDVELKDGLLVINLHREIPEAAKPKEFKIK